MLAALSWVEAAGRKPLPLKSPTSQMRQREPYLTVATVTSSCIKSTQRDVTFASCVKKPLKLWVGIYFACLFGRNKQRLLRVYVAHVFLYYSTDQYLEDAHENSQRPEELLVWPVWDVVSNERFPYSTQPSSHWYEERISAWCYFVKLSQRRVKPFLFSWRWAAVSMYPVWPGLQRIWCSH